MLREYVCDLHIHSCLSPCADLDMYPRSIVEKAIDREIDIIAICDHNASENLPFVIAVAECRPLVVIPGMELTTSEEVHVLGLFDNYEDLLELQRIVYDVLPGRNDERVFGCQPIVNDRDEVEGFNDRLLLGATALSLRKAVEKIHSLRGLAIAAHIERESFGILGQLGFIPQGLPFDGYEISWRVDNVKDFYLLPGLETGPFLRSSDAHFINDIGRATTKMLLEEPTVAEISLALKGSEGRRIMGA
ncbi:MAG: PHP domain-containing protein [Deltaproteobacteria bacterium]|nr:PHP domain-containing protein [Deltaproteobacteria bacterium]